MYAWSKHLFQPVTSQFSGAVFSAATATSLLLPKYHPIVHFVDTGDIFSPPTSDQLSIWTLHFRAPLLQWGLVNCVHSEDWGEKASQLLGLDWCLQVSSHTTQFGKKDWFFRVSESNLEDHLAYTWASTRLVRDAAYEVIKTFCSRSWWFFVISPQTLWQS